MTRAWRTFLQDLLWYRSRKHYALSISTTALTGATDPARRRVEVNPIALALPSDRHHLARIRGLTSAMRRDVCVWQQALTTALVEHKAGHIRFTGALPNHPTLHWLANALEDERQERLLAAEYPDLAPLFDLLGDATAATQPPFATAKPLARCLLWRWAHDHLLGEGADPSANPPGAADPAPDPALDSVWEDVRPLVESAWRAPSSDAVVMIAREILARIGVKADAPIDAVGASSWCACAGGDHEDGQEHEGGHGSGEGSGIGSSTSGAPPGSGSAPPAAPEGADIPGHTRSRVGRGAGHSADDPAQATDAETAALLAEIEGYARDLARTLDPPTAIARPRPSPSRGALNLRRALAEDERPFDAPAAASPHPSPSRVWAALVDLSQSMGSGRRVDSAMYGARRLTLWLDRVCELSRIPFGVYGFDDQSEPIRIAPLDPTVALADRSLIRRRITGMAGQGGTRLSPALAAALAALGRHPAERTLLITLFDGEPEDGDAAEARALLATLPRRGVQLLPLYLGNDPQVIAANTALFGHVIACSSMDELTPLARAWLRAARC
jgi:hypothetical protein